MILFFFVYRKLRHHAQTISINSIANKNLMYHLLATIQEWQCYLNFLKTTMWQGVTLTTFNFNSFWTVFLTFVKISTKFSDKLLNNLINIFPYCLPGFKHAGLKFLLWYVFQIILVLASLILVSEVKRKISTIPWVNCLI